jgi:hypothetical protein
LLHRVCKVSSGSRVPSQISCALVRGDLHIADIFRIMFPCLEPWVSL